MRVCLRLLIVAVVLVFGVGLIEHFETPKAEVLRVAGIGLLAALLAAPGSLRRLRPHALDLALAAWLLVELLATTLSRAPALSFFGEQEQHEGLLTSLALAGAYLATRTTHDDPDAARATLDAWLLAVAVACGYAFLQIAGLDPLPWTRAAQLGGRLRPFGTLGHANVLGVLSASGAAMALARAATEGRRRVPYLLVAVWLAVATVATLSRAAWLALLLGLAASAILGARAGAPARLSARGLAVAAAVVVLAAVGLVAGGFGSLVVSRFRELVSPTSGSGASRLEIWRTALAAWHARPLIGQGPDTFALVFSRFQTPAYWSTEWAGLAGHAHSVYLHALATRGVLGLAAALGVAAAGLLATRAAWRADRERRAIVAAQAGAFAALAVAGAFGAWGIAGALLATTLAGQAAALAPMAADAADREAKAASRPAHARPKPAAPEARSTSRRMAIAGALAALAVGAFAVNEMSASHAVAQAGGVLRRSGTMEARDAQLAAALAADLGEDAGRRLKWDDHGPRLEAEAMLRWAALAPEERGLRLQARDAAREAVRRAPLRAVDHQALANTLLADARAGDRAAALECEREFARALELAPQSAFVLADWARARMALGRAAEALPLARRIVSLYPTQPIGRQLVLEAARAAGDSAGVDGAPQTP